MKTISSLPFLMFTLLAPMLCIAAAPTPAVPIIESVGANQATLILQSDASGTGYVTVLPGNGAVCGTGTQIAAGQNSAGTMAPYHGSLPLTASTPGRYTIKNLAQSSSYTVCFTADSPDSQNLQEIPVSADLATAAGTIFTTPNWGTLGSSGFSAGAANYTSLAFSPDGTPHVVFASVGNSYKVTVMKFSDGAWSTVGSAGFSAGSASYTSLAFAPDGTPYVAYMDGGYNRKATVMRYNGAAWVLVGSAGFSSGSAYYPSLACAPDGTPHVAFQDSATGGKASVMNYRDGAWRMVGNAGFSAGSATYTSLAFTPDGVAYVAFSDGAVSGKSTVMKYTGAQWNVVGTAGFSPGMATYSSLAVAPDGTPFLAFQGGSPGYKATVMTFRENTWNAVGSIGFSSGAAYYLSLAITPDGTPYLAYQSGSSSYKAAVMQYRNSSWSLAGAAGISTGAAYYTSLAISPDGTPYLSYYDGAVGGKATVLKLKNTAALAVVSESNPAPLGQTTTFTATVSPASASGTVIFRDAGIAMGTATITGGSATFATTALTAGNHSITAVYSGDDNYVGATSPLLAQSVSSLTSVTVLTVPSGLAITVDGITLTAPQTFSWIPGSSHTLAITSPQDATGTRYLFSTWSDGGPISHAITVPATTASYTANFTTEYQLTTSVSPLGGGTVTPATGTYYSADTVINLTAVAASGYQFVNWTGPVSNSNSATTTVTLNSPQAVTAHFSLLPPRANVALQANGGVATASSVYSATAAPASAVNNGDRKGLKYNLGGVWYDATNGVYPDWVQITFNGAKTIDEVNVFTMQDTFGAPLEPTPAMIFTLYGVTGFTIQYWNGSTWVAIPGATVSGNNLVWRNITFTPVVTDRIRVQTNSSIRGYSRLTEVEAYGY